MSGDLLQEWAPEILRFSPVFTHYSSPLDYNTKSLKSARKSYNRLSNTLELLDSIIDGEQGEAKGSISSDVRHSSSG